jgi:signal transduction histidine kinase
LPSISLAIELGFFNTTTDGCKEQKENFGCEAQICGGDLEEFMSEEPNLEVGSPERCVLVVDDEKRMADSVASLLRTCGYQADTAYGGREAIQKLAEKDYPVVITDVRMHDVDGFEVIRSIGDNPRIAVIVITAHASTESAIEAVHHKVFDYITKPFDFQELREAVDRAYAHVNAVRFREDMISMITHDIKIPLSSIIGYSSLIFDRTTGELNPRAREFVQTINANSLKILALIDNFLTSCKIEAGHLSIYPRQVNLNFILEDLSCVLQAEIERKKLNVTVELDPDLPPVMGDENMLFRAISNIFANACKYTPVGGQITARTMRVGAPASPLQRDSACVQISNSGPGISPDELPKVFDKYRRSRAHGTIEGSGLGLYVTRYVIEAHRGKVEVTSRQNELTTFTVYLPLETAGEPIQEASGNR